MKRLVRFLWMAVILLWAAGAYAQGNYKMVVKKMGGDSVVIPTTQVQEVYFLPYDGSEIEEPQPGEDPEEPTPGQGEDFTESAFGVNFEMVWVEGGTFQMGCTSEQGSDCYSDETPAHSVSLSGYYIGKFEITQAQWRAVMGTSPSYFSGDNLPVEQVSWNEVQSFCQKLSERTGKTYTLPTEAQWEYAARGGNKSEGYKYSGGNTIGDVAWYYDNSGSTTHTVGKTHTVGTKLPNELGLYDMSGNVWEWCQDWSGEYTSESKTDPQGPENGSFRVLRGGSWYYGARGCRVSNRDDYTPSFRDCYDGGFRVVMLP